MRRLGARQNEHYGQSESDRRPRAAVESCHVVSVPLEEWLPKRCAESQGECRMSLSLDSITYKYRRRSRLQK
jgi:hypothetical protein